MGLDSFIYKRKQIGSNFEDRLKKIEDGCEKLPPIKRVYEETEMLYLRKANQIHNYFVENFASGRDDCKEIYVGISDLKELKKICDEILSKAKLKKAWLTAGMGGFTFVLDDSEEKVYVVCKVCDIETGDLFFKKMSKKNKKELEVGDLYIDSNDKQKPITCANGVTKIEHSKKGSYAIHFCSECAGEEIENREIAEEKLPTRSGFFFGDTDYSGWYLEDLRECSRQLQNIIDDYQKEIANGVNKYDIDYYYVASW